MGCGANGVRSLFVVDAGVFREAGVSPNLIGAIVVLVILGRK